MLMTLEPGHAVTFRSRHVAEIPEPPTANAHASGDHRVIHGCAQGIWLGAPGVSGTRYRTDVGAYRLSADLEKRREALKAHSDAVHV